MIGFRGLPAGSHTQTDDSPRPANPRLASRVALGPLVTCLSIACLLISGAQRRGDYCKLFHVVINAVRQSHGGWLSKDGMGWDEMGTRLFDRGGLTY